MLAEPRDDWEEVATCDLCGASLGDAEAIAGLEDAGIVRCASCGLVITSPRPLPASIGTYYPPTYYAHRLAARSAASRFVDELKARRGLYPSGGGAVARGVWTALGSTVGRLFLTNLPYAGQGRRLLDVGCGVGEALAWAEQRGWEAHGVELDPEAVELARGRGLEHVRHGRLEEQAYPGAHFDAVTLYQVLEHVYSPRAMLSECLRVLRPGGKAYVALPNFESLPRALFGEGWNGLQLPIHLYHFDARTLARLAKECGFAVEEVRYNALPVAIGTNLRHALRSGGWDSSGGLMDGVRRLRLMPKSARSGLRMNDIMLFVLRRKEAETPSGAGGDLS